MSIWFNVTSSCSWSYHHGPRSEDDWSGYVEFVRETGKTVGDGGVALTIAFKTTTPSALQRRSLSDAFLNERRFSRLAGHAFVTDSARIRGVITAVNWVTKKPFREEVFSSPKNALKWLSEVSAQPIDTERVWNEIVRTVPEEALWVE